MSEDLSQRIAEGLQALAAKKQRAVELEGVTFLIKDVDFGEAIEALGEHLASAVLGFFFQQEDSTPEEKQAASQRLANDRNLQRALVMFRRKVLELGMVNPRLCKPGEPEDLSSDEGTARVSISTLGPLVEPLKEEILGGGQGKAEGGS